jgi:flagellar motor switch protein FliN/FliY
MADEDINEESAASEDDAASLDTTIDTSSGTDPQFENVQLDDLSEDGATGSSADMNMDLILDVPVTISMEIGRTRISIRNLLQLTQGSVVELDRLAGEPLDVMVNGTLIAHGEVVVVNDKFGIRLTDVISAAERVKRLK